MIDTQEKLDAFVGAYRTRMVEQAIKELNESPENQEPDIWVSFWSVSYTHLTLPTKRIV